MFQITASRGGNVVPVPSGKYKASLTSVERKEGGNFSGEFLVWTFLADVAGELLPCEGVTSTNQTQKGKAYKWLTALLGREPAVGESLDPPVGNQCIVEVVQKDGYPRVDNVTAFSAAETVVDGIPR